GHLPLPGVADCERSVPRQASSVDTAIRAAAEAQSARVHVRADLPRESLAGGRNGLRPWIDAGLYRNTPSRASRLSFRPGRSTAAGCRVRRLPLAPARGARSRGIHWGRYRARDHRTQSPTVRTRALG